MDLREEGEHDGRQDRLALFGIQPPEGQADEDALVAGPGEGHDGMGIARHAAGHAPGKLGFRRKTFFGRYLAEQEIARESFKLRIAGVSQFEQVGERRRRRQGLFARRAVGAEHDELFDAVVAAGERDAGAEAGNLGVDEEPAPPDGNDLQPDRILQEGAGAAEIEIGENVEAVRAGSETGRGGGEDAARLQARHDGGGGVAERVRRQAQFDAERGGGRPLRQVAGEGAERVADGGRLGAADDLDDFALQETEGFAGGHDGFPLRWRQGQSRGQTPARPGPDRTGPPPKRRHLPWMSASAILRRADSRMRA